MDEWPADLTRQNGLTASTGALFLRVTNWQIRNHPDPCVEVLISLVMPDP